MSIDTLKATIGKKGGLNSQNRFNVIFTPPTQSLLNLDPENAITSLVSGTFDFKNLINDPRDIALLCESAVIPGRSILTIDYEAEKQIVKMPYSFADTEITMTFLVTNDFFIRTLFDNWIDGIVNANNHVVGYKKDYSTDVIIQALNQENIPVYGIRLEKAFPTSIVAQTLDNNAENNVQKLSVNFLYDKYVPEGPLSSTASALRSAISIFS